MSAKIKGLLLALAIFAIAGIVIYSSGVFTQNFSPNPARSSSSSPDGALQATQSSGGKATSPQSSIGSDIPSLDQGLKSSLPDTQVQREGDLASADFSDEVDALGKVIEKVEEGATLDNETPSTLVPALIDPPAQQKDDSLIEKDGKVVRMTVGEAQENEPNTSTILETTSMVDGTPIPSSQDTVIPFSLIQNIARDLVNGYWPQGTHVLATSKGVTTTSFAFLNTRYGTSLSGKFSGMAETGLARQGLLDYILMPSMVDGLYKLYAERFIRLVNQQAGERVYTRQEAAVRLTSQEIGEMYGLYARSLKSNAGCIRGFVSSGEIRHAAEQFVLAEQEATNAYMTYQENTVEAENAGASVSRAVEQGYRLKVAERESARQNLAAVFRRFTDTRNMDTSDLVFLAKWLNRRSVAHDDGLLALATTLENLAARMEREQQRYIKQ